jgi:hypothetical protein
MQLRQVLVAPSEAFHYLIVNKGVDLIEGKAVLQHALSIVLQL